MVKLCVDYKIPKSETAKLRLKISRADYKMCPRTVIILNYSELTRENSREKIEKRRLLLGNS